jgi:DNA-binding CsgD family transcriptional regulator
MSGRPWSVRDVGYLRRQYGRATVREIARRLDRSRRAVYLAVIRLGLQRHRWATMTPAREATIRRMNALGHPDTDIARRLGLLRETVGGWRRRLGLLSQGRSALVRCRVAVTTARQLRAAGCQSLAELRAAVYATRARRLGWPIELRWRAVQIVETLWLLGPRTRRQLADELEMPWRGTRKSLCGNDPGGSYLANLMRRGLVVKLGRCVPNGGPGKNTCLYALPIGVSPGRPDAGCAVPEVWMPKSLRAETLSKTGGQPAGRKKCQANGKPQSRPSASRRRSRRLAKPSRGPTRRPSTRRRGSASCRAWSLWPRRAT